MQATAVSAAAKTSHGSPPMVTLVVVLGAEVRGIPAPLLQQIDEFVEIPQRGVTRSLNVTVSAAVLLWEVVRQRARLMDEGGSGK